MIAGAAQADLAKLKELISDIRKALDGPGISGLAAEVGLNWRPVFST